MAEMPDRIWVTPLGEPDGGFWYSPCADKSDKTEYVLATTHQRALEALREALEEARAEFLYWHPYCGPDTPLQDQNPAGPSRVVAKIDTALTRIKEK